MFDFIRGNLSYSTPDVATVETQGIGYRIHIPVSLFTKLPQINEEILLYLSHVVREDSEKLFGFLTRYERDLFERVSEVSGIGPKTALSLIGHLSSEDLERAILNNDIHLLSKVPGIGKKTAERLVIDMRDRLKKRGICPATPQSLSGDSTLLSDAISALVNLGYQAQHARIAAEKAHEELGDDVNISSLITAALKRI